jgi:hypothetical protein
MLLAIWIWIFMLLAIKPLFRENIQADMLRLVYNNNWSILVKNVGIRFAVRIALAPQETDIQAVKVFVWTFGILKYFVLLVYDMLLYTILLPPY